MGSSTIRKLIQAIPIALMGMTPFAWRMAGNICGILMIAVMYILGKKLFKKRKWAITAALLMMLDTFHFAQSRMGTVDTELVLFSLLAVLFMVNYMQQKEEYKVMETITEFILLRIVRWMCHCNQMDRSCNRINPMHHVLLSFD